MLRTFVFVGRFIAVKKRRALKGSKIFTLLLLALVLLSAGCGDDFFDPTQIGRFRPVPAVNIILDSLGVAEEAPSAWEGAEEPRPIDVMLTEQDYMFGPGDVVRISIFELLEEGVSVESDYVITETGRISILQVGVIQAGGLTETQLEEEIRQILAPSVLVDPSVAVTLLQSEQRIFAIYGDGIARPARYIIPRSGFRLTDAIAIAGGIGQFNTSYIYVSRAVTGKEVITGPARQQVPEPTRPDLEVDFEREMLEIIAPRAQRQRHSAGPAGVGLIVSSTEMITDEELTEAALPEGFETAGRGKEAAADETLIGGDIQQSDVRETITAPINGDDAARIEWIFEEGRWVPVQVGVPKPTKEVTKIEPEGPDKVLREALPEDFGWEQIGTGGVQTRLIEIPADKLRSGDPRYNIVVKAGDSIHVPVDVIGEYFIYGNTNFQGAVLLTGRPLTLKMAIAAAGGLGPLAWPKRCEVIRRIGENKEEIVMVDLDKIARGEQPDFFIKPLDLINVGTHATARWRAVLRNAFRVTYGFGFIYDRNFADRDFGTRRPLPNWF